MKKIVCKINNTKTRVVGLGDIHYGNEQFDLTYFTNFMNYLYENKDIQVCLLGDLCEGQTQNCPSAIFPMDNQKSIPSILEQVGFIVEALKPLAQEHRIVSIVGGNHDHDRQNKSVGLTPTDTIVSSLLQYDETLTDKYCRDGSGCYIFFKLNERVKDNGRSTIFTLFNQHSTGGGTTRGSQINKNIKVSQSVPAMVTMTAHVHNPEAVPSVHLEVDCHKCTIREVGGWNVITNAFLKNGGGYATKAGMAPVSRNVPIVCFETTRYFWCEGKKKNDGMKKNISIQWLNQSELEG